MLQPLIASVLVIWQKLHVSAIHLEDSFCTSKKNGMGEVGWRVGGRVPCTR